MGRETRTGETFVPCPKDLCLNADQVANLEMGKGVPERFVRNVTTAFVAKYLGDPDDRRTVANWRKGLGTAVVRTWDGPRRQEYLDEPARATVVKAERFKDPTPCLDPVDMPPEVAALLGDIATRARYARS